MFQDFEITLREKIFPTFRPIWVLVSQCDSKGRKAPLHVIREGGLSLLGSHGKGTGARVSHCDAGVPVEVKIFLSQKFFQLFSKQVFSMFQDSKITLREKNFFRLSDQSGSRYRNAIPKAERPLYM